MITNLRISGFKAFTDANIRFRRLNVLVGRNGAGKSTILQGMLALRQSANEQQQIQSLRLNGALARLGTASEVVREDAERNLSFTISEGTADYRFDFSYSASGARARLIPSLGVQESKGLRLFSRGASSFSYLNAERFGPRVTYPVPEEDLTLTGRLGVRGQYAAYWMSELAAASDERSPEEQARTKAVVSSIVADFPGGNLALQASALLQFVTGDFTFSGQTVDGTDSSKFSFNQGSRAIPRATNTGVGLSYAAPIALASVMTTPDGILIVENPEAHLSPDAQSRIGRVLAAACVSGPQTFLETHSDHVLNGIRLAVKHGLIPSSQVRFFFVSRKTEQDFSEADEIDVLDDGSLTKWPTGFFDQIERDLSQL